MSLLLGVLEQGLIYAILALGVYITYKILDFPDLTVDSSFPLGAAVTAVMIANGCNPLLTLPASLVAGALAGVITGFIHIKCKVRDLLSGIITMTALYSINLRVAGRANVPFFNVSTIFKNDLINAMPAPLQKYAPLMVLIVMVLIAKYIMDWYLSTKAGYLLRATGGNPTLVTSLAKDGGMVKIQGLAIANALVALSGCVMCQYQRYFDISMGTGTMVIALASVIIGTNMFRNVRFIRPTFAVIIGSVLYKGCVAIALSLGLAPTDMKLITAALFLVILVMGKGRKKVKHRA